MDDPGRRREDAVKRLKAKRDFKNHLAAYVLVDALLVVIWATQGGGDFWPGWVIGGWGIGLVLNAWTVYFQRPITEDDIRREMETGT
jgi:hypothetical protein